MKLTPRPPVPLSILCSGCSGPRLLVIVLWRIMEMWRRNHRRASLVSPELLTSTGSSPSLKLGDLLSSPCYKNFKAFCIENRSCPTTRQFSRTLWSILWKFIPQQSGIAQSGVWEEDFGRDTEAGAGSWRRVGPVISATTTSLVPPPQFQPVQEK